ncbi:MAG: efflux RND transporter periplasmic adaptor subunit [Sediminibacterium sp.]|nr:efflux RND transporter periplasmic adaptor subunit [Sediminibacterium sp.]TXT29675.1 MAG: hypothetical protein FD136_1808 [Chitinophagaceae bacterium]
MKQFIRLSILLILVVFIGCKEKKEAKVETKKFELSDTMLRMISIDSVTSSNIDDALTLTGEITFNENNINKIFPRSSGQVLESRFTVGDKVTKGQVLAVIRSADIAGNYAEMNAANADIIIAKRQLDNQETLFKSGIASEKDLTEAKQNYEKALSVKSKIQSSITINGGINTQSSGNYNIISPIDGYIVEKKINQGNFIRSDMGENLFTISDLKNVWVYANVFEADIPKVKEGYEVAVTTIANPNIIIKGKIDKLSEVLDPTNKTLRVRIVLNNSDLLLKPEMFAKVVVYNKGGGTALRVPTKSLITLNNKIFVVKYISNKDLQVSEVSVLKTVGEITYLNSGVNKGDKIITRNQLLVFQQLIN